MDRTSSGGSSGMAHWSKDFVEHLRTIHFALVIVSTGLIILVLSSKPYNPKIAYGEVVEILGLQRVGSPAWLREQREQQKQFVPAQDFVRIKLTHVPSDHVEVRDDKDRPMQVWGTIYENQKKVDAVFAFPDDDWFQTVGMNRRAGAPEGFPHTVSEFRDWWNYLRDPQDQYIDVNFADDVIAEGTLSGLPEKSNWVLLHHRENPDPSLKKVQLTKYLGSEKSGYVGYLPESNQEVFFYSGTYIHAVGSQALLKSFFPNVCPGSFDKSFSDLAKATDGFGPLPLEEARKLLSDEAAKGSDIFEAFGMKFPADQITRWGVILLLSVQLYLFAYLRQLTGKLSSTDAGWDVPWIGMDQSLISRVIVLATVELLPCLAVALLSGLAIQQSVSVSIPGQSSHVCDGAIIWKGLPPGSYLQMLGFIVATLCSGFLGVLCWKHRPKVNEESDKRSDSPVVE